jgi:hypothetical protein
MNKVKELYDQLKKLPFPKLGYEIGDFPLYDALVAGIVDKYLSGITINVEEIPLPDKETLKAVQLLRSMNPGEEEKKFLDYFDLLETLTGLLKKDRTEIKKES